MAPRGVGGRRDRARASAWRLDRVGHRDLTPGGGYQDFFDHRSATRREALCGYHFTFQYLDKRHVAVSSAKGTITEPGPVRPPRSACLARPSRVRVTPLSYARRMAPRFCPV